MSASAEQGALEAIGLTHINQISEELPCGLHAHSAALTGLRVVAPFSKMRMWTELFHPRGKKVQSILAEFPLTASR